MQVGDVVTVHCEEFSYNGLHTFVVVDGRRLFAPMIFFPSLGPDGETKSPEVTTASAVAPSSFKLPIDSAV